MKPFNLSKAARDFCPRYPSASELRNFYEEADYSEVIGVCRAWMTEGIPCVFSEEPLLFEKVRELIAQEICIHPSDIKVVGSARTGYSMNPNKVDTKFSQASDLDLAVVSNDYFLRCEGEFLKFKDEFKRQIITPDNPKQASLWPDIIKDIDKQRQERRFIDIWKVPTKPGYLISQAALQVCWKVTEKLNLTQFGPSVKKCSLRVYRDMEAFVEQNRKNLLRFLSNGTKRS